MSSVSGVLYIGVTNNLIKRVEQHKDEIVEGFTQKYKTKKLVYYEWFTDVNAAISKEKQLKDWQRKWKIELIEKDNPRWRDLYDDLIGKTE